MARKSIHKNLSYDTERRLYYAVFRRDGRRRTRTFRTLEEAEAALAERPEERQCVPGRGCTLGQWLSFWLEEVAARDRAESTLYAYRNMARCHLIPALGQVPLRELTPYQIQNYLFERMERGLAPNTVIKHYVLLTTAWAGGAAGGAGPQSPGPGDAPKRQESPLPLLHPGAAPTAVFRRGRAPCWSCR